MPNETTAQSDVDKPSVEYMRMAEKWELIETLLGGTKAMRAAAGKYLPQEPGEKTENYTIRLSRSVLYEGLKDTIDKLASKPFCRPVTLTDLPEMLQYLEDDVDGRGASVTEFSEKLLRDMPTYGKAHVLVDFSRIQQNEEGVEEKASIAEEKEAGARAIFIRIAPPDLIGWRSSGSSNQRLTQIRLREIRVEPDGEYGDKEVHYIRVYNEDGWELHHEVEVNGKKKWVLKESGKHTFGSIFLVTIYADREGFMTCNAPLEGLAWLNLAHWQSDSDQRNILRFSRFGIIFGKGLPKDVVEAGKIIVAPTQIIAATDPNADMKYVEHSGAAIGAGRQDLMDLENRMEVLGLQPLVLKSSIATATGKAIDEGRNQSEMQSWVRALEMGIFQCFEMAARWHKTELPETFNVDIFNDFSITLSTAQDADLLLRTWQSGAITTETLLMEFKRRGYFSDLFDPAEEAVNAGNRPLPLGFLPEPSSGSNNNPDDGA